VEGEMPHYKGVGFLGQDKEAACMAISSHLPPSMNCDSKFSWFVVYANVHQRFALWF
jgi:hypothetical protein